MRNCHHFSSFLFRAQFSPSYPFRSFLVECEGDLLSVFEEKAQWWIVVGLCLGAGYEFWRVGVFLIDFDGFVELGLLQLFEVFEFCCVFFNSWNLVQILVDFFDFWSWFIEFPLYCWFWSDFGEFCGLFRFLVRNCWISLIFLYYLFDFPDLFWLLSSRPFRFCVFCSLFRVCWIFCVFVDFLVPGFKHFIRFTNFDSNLSHFSLLRSHFYTLFKSQKLKFFLPFLMFNSELWFLVLIFHIFTLNCLLLAFIRFLLKFAMHSYLYTQFSPF
jgi:hypothetical protein